MEFLISAAEKGGIVMMAHIAMLRALNTGQARAGDHPTAQARQALQDRQMTLFVYANTSKQIGDADHVKAFANVDAAEKRFEENEPEGVAFEYEVLE
jgi:hypothetical protein